MAIAFKWGACSDGIAGGITGGSATIGVTNISTQSATGAMASGDLLVAYVNLHRGSTTIDPGSPVSTGFTVIQNSSFDASTQIRFWAGYRFATSSTEAVSYPVTWTTTGATMGWMLLSFTGVDQTTPVDQSAVNIKTSASSVHIAPSITPTVDNTLWVAAEARIGANSPDVAQSPLTTAMDGRSNSGGRPEISTGYATLASAGVASGQGIFIQTAFTQPDQGISFNLIPAGGSSLTGSSNFTVCGRSVEDLFITTGVVYTFADVIHRTN